VKNRTELNPYFFYRPIKTNAHSLTLSGLLPIVIKSGAQSSRIADGQLLDADIEDTATLGDLHLGLAYAGAMTDTVIGGVALDLRLPTGAINTKTLATDNIVRIIPRLNLSWLPADWFEFNVDIGNQFTLPGYDKEDPLTGPLTTRNLGATTASEPLFSETFVQAGMTFKLPKEWFISFETAYWFNTVLIAEPELDFAMQLDMLLSVGARFAVTPNTNFAAHVGGRWNPFVDSRRQVGPTHGQLLVKLGVESTPGCDDPNFAVLRLTCRIRRRERPNSALTLTRAPPSRHRVTDSPQSLATASG
jgi:hypothetical protein